MNTKDLRAQLKALDFTKAEIEVYLTIISTGALSPQEIVNMTKLPRSTVVVALEKFLDGGLVDTIDKGKRKLYTVLSTDSLITYVARNEAKIQAAKQTAATLLPSIDQVHFLKNIPGTDITHYSGKEGLREMFMATLHKNKGRMIHRIGVSTQRFTVMPDFFTEYGDKKNELKIFTQLLLPRTDAALVTKDRDKDRNRQTRFYNPDEFDPGALIQIWDDKVGFIGWGQEFPGFIITNQVIAETFKQVFGILWIHAARK